MSLDFHWILPSLAIGARIPEDDYESLVIDHQVTHIVDLRKENQDDVLLLKRYKMDWLHLPTPDLQAISYDMLFRGVHWVRSALNQNGRVLVHCEHGIGRSTLLVLCTMISLGHSPLEAMKKAKAIRRKISPSPEQIHALIDWSHHWYQSQQISPPQIEWQTLADIAYEHTREQRGH